MATVLNVGFISCGNDEENSDNSSGSTYDVERPTITIDVNGVTSTGSKFVLIDDTNFYIDYIQYSVKQGHLNVVGFDKTGFAGEARFYSVVTYKGNAYEVLEIEAKAFDHSENLTSIIIPKGIKIIHESSFEDCHNLTSVSISESVETIHTRAFHGCRKLTDVHCKRQIPPTVSGSSTNGGPIEYLTNSEVYLDATLYIPQGSLNAYKEKNGWKDFGYIVEE